MAKKAVLKYGDRQHIRGMLGRPQGATTPECYYALAGHARTGITPRHVREYIRTVAEPIPGKMRRGAVVYRLLQTSAPAIYKPAEYTHAGFVERAMEVKER